MTTDTVYSTTDTIADDSVTALQVGTRLRALREQRQLSLSDIEELSGGEVGPSTIGAYERGIRSISLPRLNRLAEMYGVPVEHLIPSANTDLQVLRPSPIAERLTIDTAQLGQLEGESFRSLLRFIELIRAQRADRERKVITLRGADSTVVSAMLKIDVGNVVARLTDLELLAPPAVE